MGSGNAWTQDELRDLHRLWPDYTAPEVAALIPRHSVQSCRNKARALGLERSGARRLGGAPWTPDEDATVREFFGAEGAVGVARRLPGRSASAVSNRAHRLGLESEHFRRWTPEEDAVIVEHYEEMGAGAMCAAGMLPGRTATKVMNRACALGVRRRKAPTRWTPDEDKAIRAAIPLMLAEEPRMRPVRLTRLANALDRDERQVAARMRHWLKEAA